MSQMDWDAARPDQIDSIAVRELSVRPLTNLLAHLSQLSNDDHFRNTPL
jgi:hypothetical protein